MIKPAMLFIFFSMAIIGRSQPEIDVVISISMHGPGQPVNGYKLQITGTDGSDTTIVTGISGTTYINKGYFIPGHTYTIVNANSILKFVPDVADQFSTRDVTSNTKIIRELTLLPMCSVGNPKIMPTLRVKGLDTEIDEAMVDSLSYLYALMIENPSMTIAVVSLFEHEKDLRPFQRRGDIIKTLLHGMGIPAERIVTRIETYSEQHDPYIRSRKAGNVMFEIESMDYIFVPDTMPGIDLTLLLKKGNLPIDSVKVTVTGSNGDKRIAYTDAAGQIEFIHSKNTSFLLPEMWYTVEVEAAELKYTAVSDFISTVGVVSDLSITREYSLGLISSSELRLPGLLLPGHSTTIDSTSQDSLNYLYELMIQNPTMIISVIGLFEHEMDITPFIKKSNAVKARLIEMGIPSDRIVTTIEKFSEQADAETRDRKKGNVIFEVESFEYVP